MRTLILEGWDAEAIGKALLAIFGLGLFTQFLSLTALRYRVR
jgi:hypothetical protein